MEKDKFLNELKSVGVDGEKYQEYFFTDYSGEFSKLHLSEYMNYDELNTLAKKLSEVDNMDLVIFAMEQNSLSADDIDTAIDYVNNATIVYPYKEDAHYTDADLGLSYAVDIYGDEFVNVVDSESDKKMRDMLLLYFDEESWIRDYNIENSEEIEEMSDAGLTPEELDNDTLAQHFDYDAYGRDLRLNGIVWCEDAQCWVEFH